MSINAAVYLNYFFLKHLCTKITSLLVHRHLIHFLPVQQLNLTAEQPPPLNRVMNLMCYFMQVKYLNRGSMKDETESGGSQSSSKCQRDGKQMKRLKKKQEGGIHEEMKKTKNKDADKDGGNEWKMRHLSDCFIKSWSYGTMGRWFLFCVLMIVTRLLSWLV